MLTITLIDRTAYLSRVDLKATLVHERLGCTTLSGATESPVSHGFKFDLLSVLESLFRPEHNKKKKYQIKKILYFYHSKDYVIVKVSESIQNSSCFRFSKKKKKKKKVT